MATTTLKILGAGNLSVTNSGTTITVDGSNVGGGTSTTPTLIYYYYTGSSTANPIKVTNRNLSTVLGQRLIVRIGGNNITVAGVSLQLNSDAAAPIIYHGKALPAGALRAQNIYEFIYDGTNWQCITPIIWME